MKKLNHIIQSGQQDSLKTLLQRVNKNVDSIFKEYEGKEIPIEHLNTIRKATKQKIVNIFENNKMVGFFNKRRVLQRIESELEEALKYLQRDLQSLQMNLKRATDILENDE